MAGSPKEGPMSSHHYLPRRPRWAVAVLALAVTVPLLDVAHAADLGEWGPAVSVEAAGGGADPNLNTSALEGCPFQAPDGRTLFLASNRGGGEGGIDIWIATRTSPDDPWSDPVNAGVPVNSGADDFCPTMSRDGRQLYFVSTRSGGCGGADIYTARRQSDGVFGALANLGCGINSAGDEASPFPLTTAQGGVLLYFSSNRAGGFSATGDGNVTGDSDLYQAPFHGGAFGAPVLVPEVNSASTDGQPNLRRDGLELVFFSNRAGGIGLNDLYSATRTRPGGWGTPVNLGANVNTAANETRPSLSWDGHTLYFGSTRTGEGSSDIYVSTR